MGPLKDLYSTICIMANNRYKFLNGFVICIFADTAKP